MNQRKDSDRFIKDFNLDEVEELINLLDPHGEAFSKTKMLIKEMKLENSSDDKENNSVLRR